MSVTDDYGGKNWKEMWYKLEQEGNVGIDFVINPYLYREMANFLIDHPSSRVIDFGAGTNALGFQFIYEPENKVPALSSILNIAQARKNIDEFIGLEGSEELILIAKNYLKELKEPNKITIQNFEVTGDSKLFFKDISIDLAISRNFLMHLNVQALEYHIAEVARTLKQGGNYILAFLNPDYEQKKFLELYPNKNPLKVNEKYSFKHGEHGEHGTFIHYWKSTSAYETIFKKYLKISNRIECFPLTDQFKIQYARYYQKGLPMAFVYILEK